MSTDNATLIRDGFDAFLRGDFETLRELMEPDAHWLWWEITDGRPGPNAEMRLEDPDGYVLMVAQMETSAGEE